jgi:ABC-type uncharacterized transport system auxiliary subunit
MKVFSGSNPPMYYGVNYPELHRYCAQGFDTGLRIWSFSASSPFDREEMMILGPAHEVHFSSRYRWVTLPGEMVSDALHRDLARSGLFTQIVEPVDPFPAVLEMGGHIYRFAWEESETTARAVLDVEVSIWNKERKPGVLFRQHYHFESEPTSERNAGRFADAMNKLVEQLSERVRQDLCSPAKLKGSSFPAGG